MITNNKTKAISDNVVVYKISKNVLKSQLYKDLRNYIIKMYKAKQSQREATLENAKKGFGNNINKQRFESLSSERPSQLQIKTKNFLIRATSPSFNPEQRSQVTIKETSDLPQLTGFSPRSSVYKIDSPIINPSEKR